jgi:hypothetical protein
MWEILTRIKNFFSKDKFGLLKPRNIIKYFWLKIKAFRYPSWRDHLFFFILYYIFFLLILEFAPITPEFVESICLDKKYYGWSDFYKPEASKIELEHEGFTITKKNLQIAAVLAVITVGITWLFWHFQE